MGKADLQARILISVVAIGSCLFASAEDRKPKAWPEQFHAPLFQQKGGQALAVTDLWYDWPKGRNFNIIQHQLSYKMHDVEWNNGTSYYFDLAAQTCKTYFFGVGILRPDWLYGAHYMGTEDLNGFSCNVWEKEDFVTYYEDEKTERPVGWFFRTSGVFIHVLTFNVGAVLGDANWQAPDFCFTGRATTQNLPVPSDSYLLLPTEGLPFLGASWKKGLKAASGLK